MPNLSATLAAESAGMQVAWKAKYANECKKEKLTFNDKETSGSGCEQEAS